jgi:Phosphoesterase family
LPLVIDVAIIRRLQECDDVVDLRKVGVLNLNEHPGYAEIVSGDQHIADVIAHLQKSPQWPHMRIVLTPAFFGYSGQTLRYETWTLMPLNCPHVEK